MLEAVKREISTGAATEVIADLGVVHSGKVGLQDCDVSLRIERWQGAFHLCIETVVNDGSANGRVRAVKWPYSCRDRRDLGAVLVDLHVVRAGPRPNIFADNRTQAGKLLDSVMRRHVHGTYRFRSPLTADPATTVRAEIVDFCGKRTVTLAENTPRRGHIATHLPHAAFAGICAALGRFVEII